MAAIFAFASLMFISPSALKYSSITTNDTLYCFERNVSSSNSGISLMFAPSLSWTSTSSTRLLSLRCVSLAFGPRLEFS